MFFKNAYRKGCYYIIEETEMRRNKKCVQTLKIRGSWIVRKKVQKNKKKTCIIALD